jgi:hypothetical protein
VQQIEKNPYLQQIPCIVIESTFTKEIKKASFSLSFIVFVERSWSM